MRKNLYPYSEQTKRALSIMLASPSRRQSCYPSTRKSFGRFSCSHWRPDSEPVVWYLRTIFRWPALVRNAFPEQGGSDIGPVC